MEENKNDIKYKTNQKKSTKEKWQTLPNKLDNGA